MINIYSSSNQSHKTAVLNDAFEVSETETLNGISRLTFSLVASDTKAKYCKFGEYAQWGGESALYRIVDIFPESDGEVPIIRYECEHVIATLIDDVIFRTLQLDNTPTRSVIQRILSLQTTKRWVLDQCDFDRRFSYLWSNENLITALFSIPNRFLDDYQWKFNTSSYPWRVSLIRLDKTDEPEFYVREGKNLLEQNISIEGTEVCTRIYPLGYGEGVNQLTIESVNNGFPYLQSPQSVIEEHGLISRVWEDLRFEHAESLKQQAQAFLNKLQHPYKRYELGVADLTNYTDWTNSQRTRYYHANAGDIIKFDDVTTYITEVVRHLDTEEAYELTIANAPEDIAQTLADMADRARINAVYAQGATNIYAQTFSDNADPGHPARIRFYIPNEARQINKVMLTWSFDRFRGYTKGVESSPASSSTTKDGGSSTQTSSDGGGGSTTSGSSSRSTSSDTAIPSPPTIMTWEQIEDLGGAAGYMQPSDVVRKDHYHRVRIDLRDSMHSHNIDHTHNVRLNEHTHSVKTPAHSHGFDLPAHTHKQEYGIYEGDRASTATIWVDGKQVNIGTDTEVDIAPFLSVDGGGKVSRGTHHVVEIQPDKLTRIEATLTVQLFIQSEGGGAF